jgi:predicted dehydrogenase
MIRVGILGAGHLGKIHMSLLKNLKGFEIIGFYDNNPEVSVKMEKESGIKYFSSAQDLINACDAIDIVTPTPFHFEYASMAIKAAKHLFIEKPITISSAEAKKLVFLAREANIVAHAGHVERFNPAFMATESQIDRPVFIDCRRIATYNPRGTDVSVVLDLMVHDIDLVLHLVKSPVKKISATGSAVLCPTEDIAEARIEFDNGCVATISASRVATHNLRKMTVFQKENYFSMDFLEKAAVKSIVEKENDIKKITHQKLEIQPVNAIERELQLFAGAINHQKNNAVTLEEAYNTMKVADEILEVIKKNL